MKIFRILFYLLFLGALGYFTWFVYQMHKSHQALSEQVICLDGRVRNLGLKMPVNESADLGSTKFAQSWGGLQKQLQKYRCSNFCDNF